MPVSTVPITLSSVLRANVILLLYDFFFTIVLHFKIPRLPRECTISHIFVLWQNVLKVPNGASLVAQWLGIPLPMQGIRVRAVVWEDPTCRGATKPVRHNY